MYYDTSYHDIAACNANTMYHLKLDFKSTGWQIMINGVQYGIVGGGTYTYGYMSAFGTGFDRLKFRNEKANSECYIDAIDYSWASGYYVNRNKDEDMDDSENWDQTTYPAVIEYYNIQDDKGRMEGEIEKDILIRIDSGDSNVKELGQTTNCIRDFLRLIHVHIEYRNTNEKTEIEKKQMLYTLLNAFITWLKAKEYDDIWMIWEHEVIIKNKYKIIIGLECREVS